jgi:hypothetical protein
LKRTLLAFLFFLALAVALTWPLGLHLGSVLADLGDSALNTFILDWVCHALLHAPLHLYDAPIFVPDQYPLAYSENMIGIAILMLPLHAIGAVALHNLALLLGFATSALGAFLLARHITRDTMASLIAGVFYGFTNFKFDHIVHLQIVWSAWLPLLLLATLLYWRTPDRKRAAFLGVAFAMNGLSNVYFLLMGGFATLATIGFLAAVEPRRDGPFWKRLAIALGIACIVLIPVLMPYAIVSHLYGFKHPPGEVRGGSAQLQHWLIASPFDWLYGRPDPGNRASERHLFPGMVILVLCVVASVARRPSTSSLATLGMTLIPRVDFTVRGHRLISFDNLAIPIFVAVLIALIWMARNGMLERWVARSRFSAEEWCGMVWLVIGFIASLGMYGFLHHALYRLIPPFAAIRVPARWAVIAEVGLAVWGAIGAAELLKRGPRAVIGTLLLAATIVEVIPHRFEWHEVPPVAPVYLWLRDAKPGVAIELPMSGHAEQTLYLLASTTHHQPIMNGASGWDGPTHLRLNAKWTAGELDDHFFRTLERAHCRVVIVHRALLREHQAETDAFVRRLHYFRSFGTDDVYILR